jgi:hypothetical protein
MRIGAAGAAPIAPVVVISPIKAETSLFTSYLQFFVS